MSCRHGSGLLLLALLLLVGAGPAVPLVFDDGRPSEKPPPLEVIDGDGDGVADERDTCLGFDDSLDTDGDGVADGCDRCPGSDDTVDLDDDELPDGCDVCLGFDDRVDADGDEIPDGCDACPGFADTLDADGDSIPDACDTCPGFDDTADGDGDAIADACDACKGADDRVDADGDGVPDGCDACPGTDDRQLEAGDLVVCYYGNSLSVRAEAVTLGEVLGALERASGIGSQIPRLLGEREVDLEIAEAPTEDVIRRLLQGMSFTLTYAAVVGSEQNDSRARRVATVHVLSDAATDPAADAHGDSATAAVGDESSGADHSGEADLTRARAGSDPDEVSDELRQAALHSADPQARARAVRRLAEMTPDHDTRRVLSAASKDPAVEVRKAVLMAVSVLEADDAANTIAKLARYDKSSEIRLLAVSKLAAGDYPRGTAIATLKHATRDREQRVAALAAQLLREMDVE